ncbi:hypothetical protein GE300_19620 [Rhodobacteraceae bacterium 2CG4]|uniref:FlgN protein n=1 Tax=Halovulum marinum TaxID=2662447 RepID=A0A6L5Z624_9RHOB|nr:hypothetical protein [Halovulum marinum]MSU91789.1 hypothetical protein [Halovulum marinum]
MKGLSRQRVAARRILALLDQERQVLLSGNYAAARSLEHHLSRETGVLAASLAADDPAMAALLERIAELARRNCALAEAAQRGLQTGARLHEELRRKRSELATYTGTGRRLDHGVRSGSEDRRA